MRLLIAEVVTVGLVLGLVDHRRRTFEALAEYHEGERIGTVACSATSCSFINRRGMVMTPAEVRADGWHATLVDKYRNAAELAWFPLAPDPPLPD